MSVRITCINKDGGYHENPHTAISRLGWIDESTNKNGYSTRIEMYDFLKNDLGVAYTKDNRGDVSYLVPMVTALGTKYVKTLPDNTRADNLLSLGECRV